MPPRERSPEMKIHEFGELPVVYGGRTQPIDSLARNTLRLISRRATYEDDAFRRSPAGDPLAARRRVALAPAA